MVITALDTCELVKQLRAAGFTDEQAETLTMVLRKAQDIDLSYLATKDDLSALAANTKSDLAAAIAALAATNKADLAETKAEIFRAMFAQTLVIIGTVVALLKIGGH
jgi:hypothetical protein